MKIRSMRGKKISALGECMQLKLEISEVREKRVFTSFKERTSNMLKDIGEYVE
jgi:hypothetical protein